MQKYKYKIKFIHRDGMVITKDGEYDFKDEEKIEEYNYYEMPTKDVIKKMLEFIEKYPNAKFDPDGTEFWLSSNIFDDHGERHDIGIEIEQI